MVLVIIFLLMLFFFLIRIGMLEVVVWWFRLIICFMVGECVMILVKVSVLDVFFWIWVIFFFSVEVFRRFLIEILRCFGVIGLMMKFCVLVFIMLIIVLMLLCVVCMIIGVVVLFV